jgi:TolB-like protein
MSYSISHVIRILLITACIASTSVLTGCSKRYQNLPAFTSFSIPDTENGSVGRFKTSYLADQIHAYFRGNMAGPIAVTTFVEIDNLYQSSTFGRIIAEQLISELSMKGYNVIEIRLSDAVQIMENEGELGLSRQTDVLRPQQALSGLVVGTYAASNDRVYLNTRLIDPRTSNIISVGSVEISKTKEISQLLRGNSLPSSLERIPVRHLSYQKSPMPYYFSGTPFIQNPHDQRSEEFAKKLMQEVPREEQKEDQKKEAYQDAQLPPAR